MVNVFWLNILIGEESGTLAKQLGMIFNGIIAAITFVGSVFTIVMIRQVADDCPPQQECSSWTFSGAMVVLVILFVTSFFAIFGIAKTNNVAMRVANFVFILFGFVLLLMAIVLSMASGLVSDINSYYNDNWSQIRAELNANNYCDDVDPVGENGEIVRPDTYNPMDDPCKTKIQAETEQSASKVVAAATFVIIFVAVGLYFNQRAMKENNAVLNDLAGQTQEINKAKKAVKEEKASVAAEKAALEAQLAALKAS